METNPRQSSESQTEFALQLGVGVEHDLASQVVLILVGLVGYALHAFGSGCLLTHALSAMQLREGTLFVSQAYDQ